MDFGEVARRLSSELFLGYNLEEDGYRLVSLNPDYSDMFASAEDNPRIVGKIIGHFKPVVGG